MLLRWLKFIAIVTITPLLMATSCVKFGPYYSTEHEIKCPPEEYHLPMFVEKDGYTLQMTDKMKGWCSGLPTFTISGLDKGFFQSRPVMVYARIIRSSNSCKIAVAVPTHVHGMAEKVDWEKLKETKFFQASKKATEIFPQLTRLKTTGKTKVVTGEAKMESIRSWCGDI